MIENLDYNQVPKGFTHCFNGQCPQASTCLRHQASRFIPATVRNVSVLNPSYVVADGDCPEYMSDTPVRYAYGWTPMFNKLPYEKAVAIKAELLGTYGKNEFYRLKRKEKSFSPQAQRYVKRVFLRFGVEDEPVYEEYRYEYVWQKP